MMNILRPQKSPISSSSSTFISAGFGLSSSTRSIDEEAQLLTRDWNWLDSDSSPVIDNVHLLWDNMVFGINTRLPSITRGDMFIQWTLLAFLLIEVLTIGTSWYGVVIPEETSLLQLWQ
jgi:hypothetical protein